MKLAHALLPLAALPSLAIAGFFNGQQQQVMNEADKIEGDNPLYYCAAHDDDILVIDYVDLAPNPPKSGETLTITFSGNFTQDIEEGAYAYLTVKYGLIRLIYQKENLCEQMKNLDKECPIEKGEIVITRDVEIPDPIPPGNYHVLADVYTKDDEKITCLSASVHFGG